MAWSRVCKGDYIQGHFLRVADPNGELPSRSPGDLGQTEIPIPFSYEHVHEAISAAKRGFVSWKRLPAKERAASLSRYRDALKSRTEELAQAVSFEVGKPLWESRLEIQETIQLIAYFLETGVEAEKPIPIPDAAPGCVGVARFKPRGVMAIIIPAAEPVLTLHQSMIPSLIHGNTVVFKSSKHAPFTGQFLAELMHESSVPAGVVNMVHGDAEAARRLVGHQDVDGVFFTGPYETGFKIKKQLLSDYWKVLVMEMGGKNSAVIWDDCQFEKALHETLMAAFLTTGQRCRSTSRIILHEKISARFIDHFHEAAKKCAIGNGLETESPVPMMGPLISEAAMENYLRYQGIAIREGCEEIMRGKTLERDPRGYYVSPSLHLVKKADAKSVYQKNEIHGPNVAFFVVRDLDEAGEILNQPQHGLVSTVYTGARENYVRLVEDARLGLLHWNRMTTEACYRLPSGGIKKSGNHRPMGSFAVHQCTYPLSSLENTATYNPADLPAALPRE